MDLMEFVTARLDDTEAAARAVRPLGHVFDMGGTRLDEKFSHGRVRFASEDGRSRIEGDAAAARHFGRHDPARVLREVEFGRKILAEYERLRASYAAYPNAVNAASVAALTHVVSLFAERWDDHPDYPATLASS